MIKEILYNIFFPFLFAIISSVIPLVVTSISKSIDEKGWGAEIDESAKKVSRHILVLLIKGEVFCFICIYLLYLLEVISNVTIRTGIFIIIVNFLYFIFLSIKFDIRVVSFVVSLEEIVFIPIVLLIGEDQLVGFIAALASSLLYYNYKFLVIKNRKKSMIQYVCCFLYALSISVYSKEVLFKTNTDISIFFWAVLLMIPLICYTTHERSHYEKIYKYTKVKIHLKNSEIISGIRIDKICKKNDWFSVQIETLDREILIHENNIDFLEYYND